MAESIEAVVENFDPNDPESLEALEKAALSEELEEAGEEPSEPEEKAEEEPEEKADEKPEGKAEGESEEPSEGEGQEDGGKWISTKDGKHKIPYYVLEREREARAQAEAKLKELQEAIEAQQRQIDEPSEETEIPEIGGRISDEDIAEMEEYAPEMAKMARAMNAAFDANAVVIQQNQKLAKEVEQLREAITEQEQQREASVRDEIEAAIAATPELAEWRKAADNPEDPKHLLWERAVKVDTTLRDDPEWSNKSFEERFSQVVKTVKAISGIEDKPEQPKPAKKEKPAADTPTTLSDVPGGEPPASTPAEEIENASTAALGQKFLDMTPEQIESYLARLGL